MPSPGAAMKNDWTFLRPKRNLVSWFWPMYELKATFWVESLFAWCVRTNDPNSTTTCRRSTILRAAPWLDVAEVDGQWLALLTFSAPALHLKARERWIGWSPRQRARRLGLVVNNSRFLVLPERQRYPNLASRVLALA